MGRYDCPAGINYILNITGRENVTLITYSLGIIFTTLNYIIFVCCNFKNIL